MFFTASYPMLNFFDENNQVHLFFQLPKVLKKRGVKFFAKPFKAPTFDKYFATFYDADDNMVQLIGGK